MANEQRLLNEALTPADAQQLERLLAAWLARIETPDSDQSTTI